MDSMNEILKRLKEARETRAYDEIEHKQLISMAQNGDQQAFESLLRQYDPIISKAVRKFFLDNGNGDEEDLRQIANLGFWDAVKTYDIKQKDVYFSAYARMMMNRKLTDALRKEDADVRKLNNLASSFDEPVAGDEDGDSSVGDGVAAPGLTPEEEYVGREGYNDLVSFMREKLSDQERDVIRYYIKGYKVSNIVEETGMGYKKVENTVMRVKNKLADYLRSKGKFNESKKLFEGSIFSPEEKKVLASVLDKIDSKSIDESAASMEEIYQDALSKLDSDVEYAASIIEETSSQDVYDDALESLETAEEEVRDIYEETEDPRLVKWCQEILDNIRKAREIYPENLKSDPYAERGLRREDFF